MRLIWMGIVSGCSEVWAHKLRSFLTLFGIVLGAAALVGMIGVVNGLLRSWETMIYETGGIERITVNAGPAPESQREKAALSPGRTLNDVDALLAAVPVARRVSAEVGIPGGARLYYQGNAASHPVRGVLPATFIMDRFEVSDGRLIGELDLELQTQVAVVGISVAQQLFRRGVDPVGRVITINGQPFTVVGVLKDYSATGSGSGRVSSKNYAVFIPLTTAQTLYRIDENVDTISIQLADIEDMPHALEQVKNVLMQTHRGIQDIRLETREDLLRSFERTRDSYFVSLGGVAAIGLIVGGIGIMNVMLASISERVREIGVRRALGAKRVDILVQILSESVTLALAGGIFGLFASVGLILLLQIFALESNRPVLSVWAMGIGIGSSALVGVLAGLYPAFRAARLQVVEALRTD
jgi:ABC-type antimicrobial peptide transport system permease subunit